MGAFCHFNPPQPPAPSFHPPVLCAPPPPAVPSQAHNPLLVKIVSEKLIDYCGHGVEVGKMEIVGLTGVGVPLCPGVTLAWPPRQPPSALHPTPHKPQVV